MPESFTHFPLISLIPTTVTERLTGKQKWRVSVRTPLVVSHVRIARITAIHTVNRPCGFRLPICSRIAVLSRQLLRHACKAGCLSARLRALHAADGSRYSESKKRCFHTAPIRLMDEQSTPHYIFAGVCTPPVVIRALSNNASTQYRFEPVYSNLLPDPLFWKLVHQQRR
jgi:hypothetical protein